MRGLTLVELLVSLAIGLVLMIAVVSAYLGSAGASRVAEAQGRMNEDAQAALSILSQQIRMAGNNPRQAGYASDTQRNPVFGTGTFAIRGCDSKFSDVTAAMTALTCAAGSSPDALAVMYEADQYNTVKSSTNAPTDCLGQAITATTSSANVWSATTASVQPTSVTFTVADNRFYIGTSTAVTSPSLFCKGNGGATPQPLVENVEDMQIEYGVAPSTATSTLTVAGYLTATQVVSHADLASLATEAERWARVATVRVCLVVRSESPAAPDPDSAKYRNCSGVLTTAPDLRLRRAYSTTVVLRNRLGS